MKTVVTHHSPDLDAIVSVWLILRFHTGWENAALAFVHAGKTLGDAPPDEDNNIIHVDTGMGRFDHHQLSERTCAARVVLDYLKQHDQLRKSNVEPLERIVDVVTIYDNFGEVHFPDPANDIYMFSLNEIINGVKAMTQDDAKTVEMLLPMLDGLLLSMKNKVGAEKEIKKGITMTTKYGKSLFIETANDEAMKVALKTGYTLVVRKDPNRGHIRIKSFPSPKYELTELYQAVLKADNMGTWFLHGSKCMLLNGTFKNRQSIASPLSIARLIEIIRSL